MNYIMLPAYNEDKTLATVIASIADVLNRARKPFRFIVCDDGSSDDTPWVLAELAERLPITVVRHHPNLGVAQAFRSLFQEGAVLTHQFSGDDVFVMMEADQTSDPGLLPEMIRLIETGRDVVCASRYRKGGKYHRFPAKRLFLSVCANGMMKICFPIKGIRDYTIFYRAYSSHVLRQWFTSYPQDRRIESDGFAGNAEILIKLRPFLRTVAEVPLVYRYDFKRGKSKLTILSTIYGYLIKKRVFFRLFRSLPQAPSPHTTSPPSANAETEEDILAAKSS